MEMVNIVKHDGAVIYCTPADLAQKVINKNLTAVEIKSVEDMSGHDLTQIITQMIAVFDTNNIYEQLKYEQLCCLVASMQSMKGEKNDKLQTQEALLP